MHDADSLQYLTGADTPFASTGGWHDAGDYGKYVNNGAFSVGMLLAAWEHFQPTLAGLSLPIPEHGKSAAGGSAPLPDFLWEVKWELDWLLTAQNASGGGGGLPDKLTALAFESYGTMPDADGQKRYFSGIGTAMTANFVAVMAEAARIYQDGAPADAAKYLAAAQLGYAVPRRQRRSGRRRQRQSLDERDQRLLDRPLLRDRSRTIGCGRPPRCGRRPAIRQRWPTSRRARERTSETVGAPTSTGRTSRNLGYLHLSAVAASGRERAQRDGRVGALGRPA